MNTPLTPHIAAIFGIAGVAVAFVAGLLRRQRIPADWDPYRWRQLQQRLHPAPSPVMVAWRSLVAGVSVAIEHARRPRRPDSRGPGPFPHGVN